ncbi:MAG TPA: class A beta-lactamase-related serine hydrolase [bacterium]|nr:class A beta-lactamase-related serine hydrolase [bacterium]
MKIQLRKPFLSIVLLFLLPVNLISQVSLCKASQMKICVQAVLDSLRHEYKFPGATAAYILPDGTVETVATGLADVELNIPMTPQSRMLAASIGKTFAGALVLALVQEGKLQLDDPIPKWLAERPWFSRLPNHDEITLRQLLTHSAGIPNHVEADGFKNAFAKNWNSDVNPLPPESLIAFVLDQLPLFKPGQGWHYSDTGYILVGLIIEAVTGGDYYEQVRQRFLRPLQLTLTTPSDRLQLPGLAAGYMAADNAFGMPAKTTIRPGVMAWHPGIEWTGGGFVSNPRDLVLWAKVLYEGRALAGNYLEHLLKSVPISQDDPDNRYGIAVAIRKKGPFGPTLGHGGWIPGYCSSLRYYPEHGIAIAFQINTDVGVIDHSTSLIADMENGLAKVVIRTSQN